MWRMPMMKSLGLSGLPVLQAGQASWQRPHSVQVKPSSRSFQPRSCEGLEPERRVLGLEVHLRQLAARRELAEEDVREGRRDVEVLAERQVAQERGDERDVAPTTGRAKAGLERRRATSVRSGTASAFDDERARDVAVAPRPGRPGRTARSRRRRRSSPRMSSASRLKRQAARLRDEPAVERPARSTTRTITATTFCIALIGAHSSAVERDREDRLDDPAGDDVGRADRQQHEAPEDPGVHDRRRRGSLNILRLDERVLDEPDDARRDVRRTGSATAGRPRRPAGGGPSPGRRTPPRPRRREDQRVARDVGERRRTSVGSRSVRRSRLAARASRGRTVRRGSRGRGPARGTMRLERLERALAGCRAR